MSKTISIDYICSDVSNTYDPDYGPHSPYDTLPLPCEVEHAFHHHEGGDVNAWFEQHGINAEPIGKLIQYSMICNPETGRYRFDISGSEQTSLALPIVKGVASDR